MRKVVFFDGVCNLCNFAVDFILKWDRKNALYFASLQGETAKNLSLDFETLAAEEQSVFYQDESGRIYQKSSAAIRIAIEIFLFGFLLYPLLLIPSFIRDGIYKWIAKNRYKWFGKRETCRLPTDQEKARFLP